MPTETPASDFGTEANAKPTAASATNINFFIVLPPQTLPIEHNLRRKVAGDYSLPETGAYFG